MDSIFAGQPKAEEKHTDNLRRAEKMTGVIVISPMAWEKVAVILMDAVDATVKELKKLPGCQVIHMGYPKGSTCIDQMEAANEYTGGAWVVKGERICDGIKDPLLADLREGNHLCDQCRVAYIVSELSRDFTIHDPQRPEGRGVT